MHPIPFESKKNCLFYHVGDSKKRKIEQQRKRSFRSGGFARLKLLFLHVFHCVFRSIFVCFFTYIGWLRIATREWNFIQRMKFSFSLYIITVFHCYGVLLSFTDETKKNDEKRPITIFFSKLLVIGEKDEGKQEELWSTKVDNEEIFLWKWFRFMVVTWTDLYETELRSNSSSDRPWSAFQNYYKSTWSFFRKCFLLC